MWGKLHWSSLTWKSWEFPDIFQSWFSSAPPMFQPLYLCLWSTGQLLLVPHILGLLDPFSRGCIFWWSASFYLISWKPEFLKFRNHFHSNLDKSWRNRSRNWRLLSVTCHKFQYHHSCKCPSTHSVWQELSWICANLVYQGTSLSFAIWTPLWRRVWYHHWAETHPQSPWKS